MPIEANDEQKSYITDKAKLQSLAAWVLGAKNAWADKCRKEIRVPEATARPSEKVLGDMCGYLEHGIGESVLVRLVNGYHQDPHRPKSP